MLDTKYYIIISKILNENLCNESFNYESIMDYSRYKYCNYVKLSNLKLFIKFLKKWGFIQYKKGGRYPFKLTYEIPLSLVDIICKNKYYTDIEMKNLIREHSVIFSRRDKIKRIKEKIKS